MLMKNREAKALGASEIVKFEGEFFFCEGIDELGAGTGKPADTMMAVNYKDHLAFMIQPGSMLWKRLVIPKSAILRWRKATLSEITEVRGPSAGQLFASGLMTGALGVHSDLKKAKARAEAQGVSITYSCDGTETTVFFRPKGWTSAGTSKYYENLVAVLCQISSEDKKTTPAADAAVAGAGAPAVPAASEVARTFCPTCGAPHPAEARFCESCGEELRTWPPAGGAFSLRGGA